MSIHAFACAAQLTFALPSNAQQATPSSTFGIAREEPAEGAAAGGPDVASTLQTAQAEPVDPDEEALPEYDTKAPGERPAPQAGESGDEAEFSGPQTAAAIPTGNVPEAKAPTAQLPEAKGNGSLAYEFPIVLPDYRGFEPSLALEYVSSRKHKTGGLYQGWLGYGFGLNGFPVVERGRPRQGVPAFDAEDVFYLNDGELVACVENTVSPSCAAGGTHATENESYNRIRFDAASNSWIITERDGTSSTLTSVGTIAGSTAVPGTDAGHLAFEARWLITSRQDAQGNTVTYSYDCPDLPVCYPLAITYNGTEVRFYRENRPDEHWSANGHTISRTRQRIRTIAIRVGEAMRAAYALEYDQAPVSGTSRLVRIRQFGTDAVLDAAGGVAGGSERPATQLSYKNYEGKFTALQPYRNVEDKGDATFAVTDIDHDGRDEWVTRDRRIHSYGLNNSTVVYPPVQGWIASDSDVFFGNPFESFVRLKAGQSKFLMTYQNFGVLNLFQFNSFSSTTRTICPNTTDARLAAICSGFSGNQGLVGRMFVADPDGDGVEDPQIAPSPWVPVSRIDLQGDGTDSQLLNAGDNYAIGRPVNGTWGASPIQVQVSANIAVPSGVSDFATQVPINTIEGIRVGDINGDDVGDLVFFIPYCGNVPPDPESQSRCRSGQINTKSTLFNVYLGAGDRFVRVPPRHAVNDGSSAPFSGTLATGVDFRTAAVGDFDGDGRDELSFAHTYGLDGNELNSGTANYNLKVMPVLSADGKYEVALPLALQAETATGAAAQVFGGSGIGDLNGDGALDAIGPLVVVRQPANPNLGVLDYRGSQVSLSDTGGTQANLLVSITTQTGAVASLGYKPSSVWANSFLPGVSPTLTSMSVSDGRGQVATTSYTYAGGLFDPLERMFLGYRTVTETRPLAAGEPQAPSIEFTFRQDFAGSGLAETTIWRDGAGAERKQVTETYTANNSQKPWWIRNTRTDTRFTENIALTTRVIRSFDEWNNITALYDHGRMDVVGDEVFSFRGFAPNLQAYLVSLPRYLSDFDGPTTTGNRLKLEYYYYDGATSNTASPVKGDLTRRLVYADYPVAGPTSLQWEYFGYDGYGNRIRSVDAEGCATETDYDPLYHLFPVSERLPKYFACRGRPADSRFVVNAGFDPVCGGWQTRTDINNILHTLSRDAFCRPLDSVNTANGFTTRLRYYDDGDPNLQRIDVLTPLPGGTAFATVSSHYDGRGRTWLDVSNGATDSAPRRVTKTTFDARGNVEGRTHPHFAGEVALATSHSYDWADRLVSTINPDGTIRSFAHGLQATVAGSASVPLASVVVTDEEGQQTRTVRSARGDTILVERTGADGHNNGGAPYANTIHAASYDGLGRLTGVTDEEGAVWSYVYDLAGNRRSASDPDLGIWTYRHDRTNLLVEQTDARGVVTSISHDQMRRPLERRIVAPVVSDPVLMVNTYDEARAGAFNTGQLTTTANAAVTAAIDWHASGNEKKRVTTIGGQTHTREFGEDMSELTLWARHDPAPSPLIGSPAAPWRYDASGRLKSIPRYIGDIAYEADGQTRRIVYSNTVATDFAYSPARRLLSRLTTTRPNGERLIDNVYTRDRLGRITSIAGLTLPESWTYVYDGFDRLATATNAGDAALSETFAHTPSGNPTSRARLSSQGAFAYPADGFMARP